MESDNVDTDLMTTVRSYVDEREPEVTPNTRWGKWDAGQQRIEDKTDSLKEAIHFAEEEDMAEGLAEVVVECLILAEVLDYDIESATIRKLIELSGDRIGDVDDVLEGDGTEDGEVDYRKFFR